MSRKFLSYNPDTGLLITTAEEDGKNVVKYEQDLEPFWDVNAQYRAEANTWEKGKADGMAHYAFVPDLVIIDMLQKHGVNFYLPEHGPRVRQLIETEYSKCKITDKKLWIPT